MSSHGSRYPRRTTRCRQINLLSSAVPRHAFPHQSGCVENSTPRADCFGRMPDGEATIRCRQYQPREGRSRSLYQACDPNRLSSRRILLSVTRRGLLPPEQPAIRIRADPIPGAIGDCQATGASPIDEGFDELYYVRISESGQFVVEEWINEV